MSNVRQLTADRGDVGRRLDLVVRRHLLDLDTATRTRVQKWIEGGQVSVNDHVVRRVSTRAALGDVLRVVLPDEPPKRAAAAEDTELRVLFEDSYLLAIDKPAGVVVHPTYRHVQGTLLNALLWRARHWPAPARPSFIGRLDKQTSGVVLVAKTAAVHAAMQRIMAASASEKDYLAVVLGRVNVSRGAIELRLGRQPGDRRRVVASRTEGAASLTRFERLARVAAPRAGLALLRCRIVTGRMHQIRVHLAARGWPIVGDEKYGSQDDRRISDPALAAAVRGFPRQALHAWRVAFAHPITRQRVQIEAPVPEDLDALLRVTGLGLQ